jgi:cellobiose phosphorylase
MQSIKAGAFGRLFRGNGYAREISEEQPLRAELFSVYQMEQHGKALASWHKVSLEPAQDQLLGRLSENERILTDTVNLLTETVKANRRITPAGEWLLDNFYLVEEQIRLAKRHLPKGYSRELPRLLNGSSAGLPRVYDLALETISHGDGRIDPNNLGRFVSSYQTVAPLKLGELWAIPIMLRLALIENLRRVAARVSASKKDRERADLWADQMIKVAETDPKSLILVIADMARSNPPMVSSFVAELARRLQGHSTALALPLTWIEQRLSESGLTIELLVQSETQQQATDQVSVSNSIGSLRFLAAIDWEAFVESNSAVEHVLREDPAGVYEKMDFATRDRYRHVVEKMAKNSSMTEWELARSAVELARQRVMTNDATDRSAHVGYYLTDKGTEQLERRAQVRLSFIQAMRRLCQHYPLSCYLGTILIGTLAFTVWLVQKVLPYRLHDWLLVLLCLVIVLCSSQLALALVNWLVTLFATPHPLPKLDFSKGIAPKARTLVVVPTMLVNSMGVESLVEALEVRYVANQDENLHFGLLTDFPDACEQNRPDDVPLLLLVQKRITDLNQKYRRDAFFLFHRARSWNPVENIWMGYERKRGKLGALNAFLRGQTPEKENSFSLVVGETEVLPRVKFVITLDTDTQLPRDAARQFVGAMMHPLNRARYDEQKRRVTQGYGILQPRVSLSLSGEKRSLYSTLFGSETGIDPYTRTVSDVYQDLFGEGSFIGKGIYDVDIFEQALKGRFPENRILSHDLLEGCYVRSALLTDVQLYEEYPHSYKVDMSRRYRWIRGDWQLLGWLCPIVPDGNGRWEPNPLSLLSRWKLFDNLRRSLVPPALIVLLMIGWFFLPSPWFWTATVVGFIVTPLLVASAVDLTRKPEEVLLGQHLHSALKTAMLDLAQAVFTLAQLPYEASRNLNAILRTLWRMLVSRHKLLEWVTSSEAFAADKCDLATFGKRMMIAPVSALAIAVYLLQSRPDTLLAAAPILLLWFVSPFFAWQVSKPLPAPDARLTSEQHRFLQNLARRTWAFFETFTSEEDNWLPPDNYQEHPVEAVAHRTSPTNIGLSLLANLSAYDFGYIPGGQLIERTEKAFNSMQKLDRYRGHFYNWYDTQTLKHLQPAYISTVDSGNLAANLLTLRPGLLSVADETIVGARLFEGLRDTAAILAQAIKAAAPTVVRFQAKVQAACEVPLNTLGAVSSLLNALTCDAEEIAESLDGFTNGRRSRNGHGNGADSGPSGLRNIPGSDDARFWSRSLARQCRAARDELVFLAPWTAIDGADEMLRRRTGISSALTLHELAALELPITTHKSTATDVTAATASGASLIGATTTASPATGSPATGSPAIGSAAIGSAATGSAATGSNAIGSTAIGGDVTPAALTDSALSGIATRAVATTQIPPASATLSFEDIWQKVELGSARATERISQIRSLASQAFEFARLDYQFLYDSRRNLLSIGFNVEQRRLDSGCYDLLASEARLCDFIAIAQGQLPQESWFALGRLLTTADGEPVLFSWSGSMFEYLMPLLVMPRYENTLLDQTCKAVVRRQIEYGNQHGVPWGVSESGYFAVDLHLIYQYRAFGVPGLGLRRGLGEDLVIAPYASALALMVAPQEACLNLQRLMDEGFGTRYGLYEAIDYTRSRLPRGKTYAVVESYMAHHQGMTFLSLAYLLLNRRMQERFQSDPTIQATLLLLQERIPLAGAFHSRSEELTGVRLTPGSEATPVRAFSSANTPFPEVQLLSNSRYHVMMTNAGGGYSRWKDLAVTRWSEDSTCDNQGIFSYVRDLANGEYWSTTYQPTSKRPDLFEAIFSDARIEFRRHDNELVTHTEVVVSSEDDIELRRVRVTNQSSTRRVIDVTSYGEVVLAPMLGDALHPAFSKLFVQTEVIEPRQAILCTRRARSPGEKPPWMFHMIAVQAANSTSRHVSYETDRSKFIGRGNTLQNPDAMLQTNPLSGSQGSVLDPIVAIRYRITLEPEEEATFNIITGVGAARQSVMAMVEKYSDRAMSDRVFDLAWTHSQVLLRQLNATDADAQLYSRLASAVIYANPAMRADASTLMKNRRGQSGLWSYAISGDLPIVLVQIRDQANIELIRQLVQAHAYWRLKGLAVDLVIWNEDHAGYRQQLQEQILGLIAAGVEANLVDRPGGIFVRAAEQISLEDRVLLQSVARAVISDGRGTLEEQVSRRPPLEIRTPPLKVVASHRPELPTAGGARSDLILGNGLGGFTPDGREYVITTSHEQTTPAPWSNILANPFFGCVVSESGGGYTWCENAHEYRLTPWSNDPVSDSPGEALYIRDEQTGYFWSPTPQPARGATPYVTRHGFGYTIFEHTECGIVSELWLHVALDAPVKFYTLKLRNNSGRTRSLSATAYIEWVLGDLRSKSCLHVTTEIDVRTGALFARNSYNAEFAERVAFLDIDGVVGRTLSGDRTEFIGRNGTLLKPAAMSASRLSGKVGAGLDPCGAMQAHFDLSDGEERELIFRLGSGRDANDAATLVRRFRGSGARFESFEAVCQYWKHTLGAVNVDTPDSSLNMLVNGWLLYQTIACRLFGRSGFYQSGGAFGFRDQLQDTMSLIHAEPRLLREHLVRCAARQFLEGDVQHWWHPPSGRGVRTHCSDDYLWLPLATQRYVQCTGDTGVLDESMHCLEGRPVSLEEESYYDLPGLSEQSLTLYEHCQRAIRNGLRYGSHGLPLMGTGDWNDGMNLVGEKGKGESVWLGFFLYHVLVSFKETARLRGDTDFVELCESEAKKLQANLQESGWDGQWYRRAYFDDGTPLGSAENAECRIDSIAQSWSVLSGAAQSKYSIMAMDSLDRHLVRRDQALIQLLDPPFDKSELNPGYIRGYVPGVRENGGQYTHGAIWAAMAFAALGDRERAWELYSMINPIRHASSAAGTATYRVEPYVMAADVYAVPPHTGRGGWTWYTGSAGWMYRLIVESLLGIKLEVNKLRFTPCLPQDWTAFKVHYRYRETVHHITVRQVDASGDVGVFVDSKWTSTDHLTLYDDRQEHFVEVRVLKGTDAER